jgi:transposase-like protein
MGQVRHGSATTTHAVRATIQRSQASLAALRRKLGIGPKKVPKWRKRTTLEDLKTGPKASYSTTLTEAEEAMVVAFRWHTLLPLDDCLLRCSPRFASDPVNAASLPPAARHVPAGPYSAARCLTVAGPS